EATYVATPCQSDSKVAVIACEMPALAIVVASVPQSLRFKAANFGNRGFVGRASLDHDDLEVLKGLIQDGTDRCLNKASVVETRNNDADQRVISSPFIVDEDRRGDAAILHLC